MQPPRYRASREEPYDASDPAQVEQAEQAARIREEQRRAIELSLLSSPQGRDWVWQLLSDCRTFEAVIHETADYAQGWENGKREIGLSLMRRLARTSPRDFALMLTEHPDV